MGGGGGGGREATSLYCAKKGGQSERVSEVMDGGTGMGGEQGGKEGSVCILGEIARAVVRYVLCVYG
jgi:hypothetical protein